MHRSFRILIVTCFSLALSACFSSRIPLISEAENEILITTGYYKVFEFDESDGEADLTWSGQIDVSNGRITSPEDEHPFENMRVRSLTADIFVGQSQEDEDSEAFLYVLIFAYDNGTLGFHLPDCGELGEATRTRLELELGQYNTCEFEDWYTLREALMIYVREQGDAMIISQAMYRVN
jgi:hypothetical protein